MAEKKENKPETPKKKIRGFGYAAPIAIKGSFLDVFKVVKKDKERKAKEDKKDS